MNKKLYEKQLNENIYKVEKSENGVLYCYLNNKLIAVKHLLEFFEYRDEN